MTPPALSNTTSPTAPLNTAGFPETSKLLAEPVNNDTFIGSPLKKQRASVSGADENLLRRRMEAEPSSSLSEALGVTSAKPAMNTSNSFGEELKSKEPAQQANDEDEEL